MSGLSADRPFAGQQVVLIGKLTLLSRRDTRAIVERLGGTFSPDLTPRTTIVVAGVEPREVPEHIHRVLTESDLCKEAGLPDLETLRARYYAPRDLRGMYPGLRDDHLRYLEKWGLIRPVAGRYSFADLHVIRQWDLPSMDLENSLAASNIGERHHDLPVKAARPEQRRVEDVRTVAGGNQNNAIVGLKAVHFHQKLVQRLFPFIMTST